MKLEGWIVYDPQTGRWFADDRLDKVTHNLPEGWLMGNITIAVPDKMASGTITIPPSEEEGMEERGWDD